MDGTAILIWVAIGLIAGWLASLVVGGGGMVRSLIIGLIGAVVGGFLFRFAGIPVDLGNVYVNEIVVAAVGAIVVVLLARLIAR
jgi:uncharacterized membrane protein YeaQ/YmgE (transglycosylase-associated protein family)